MNDKISIDRLNQLHPKVKDTFKAFIEEAEQALGITLRITYGYRTIAEQNALYAQGRTTPGKKVTNAKGGQSYHNYRLAIDLAHLTGKTINWNFDYSLLQPFSVKYGIEWGGTWKFVDKPHFQITLGYSIAQLAKLPVLDGVVVV